MKTRSLYVPEQAARQIIEDFMPRVRPASIEAMIDVLYNKLIASEAAAKHHVTHQSLSKNLKTFENLVYKIANYPL